eukprot:scaffold1596_cov302-Pinguiococcus_pyrenoidosus.AAC.66
MPLIFPTGGSAGERRGRRESAHRAAGPRDVPVLVFYGADPSRQHISLQGRPGEGSWQSHAINRLSEKQFGADTEPRKAREPGRNGRERGASRSILRQKQKATRRQADLPESCAPQNGPPTAIARLIRHRGARTPPPRGPANRGPRRLAVAHGTAGWRS